MNITSIIIGAIAIFIALKFIKVIGKVFSTVLILVATVMLLKGVFGIDAVQMILGLIKNF